MRTQLNAFTILEMVVTILLTLILFSLLYLSYHLIQRQLDQASRDLSDILRTELCLDVRMEEAGEVTANGTCIRFASPLKNRGLLFEKGYILLENETVRDTVYKGSYTCNFHIDPELDLVDRIDVEFVTARDTVSITSVKRYLPGIQLKRKEVDFEY